MSDQIDYDELRTKVEAGVQRQKNIARYTFFGINILMFVIFTIISFAIAGSNPDIRQALERSEDIWALLMLPYMGWIMAIVFQGISLVMDSGITDKQIRGQIIAREFGEEMLKIGEQQSEKAKRNLEDEAAGGGEMVIGDDGELKYIDDERSQSASK
ncbi:MAG: hypothetical protein H7X77_03105 [Anaerolineae bacterium]|nr:hypothetical protein [Anaerolineae bacterium]